VKGFEQNGMEFYVYITSKKPQKMSSKGQVIFEKASDFLLKPPFL
jgi:hypothetical protein